MLAYERYGRALLRKAERLLGNREDAEDVVQALFVDIWSRRQDEPGLSYLFRAVTNRCLNHLRDRANRTRLLDRHQPALRGQVRTRCDERVITLELLLKLNESLDADCLEILVYRYFDDLTQDEIADVAQVSRKTVAKRLETIHRRVLELDAGVSEAGP
jgi:RNA polymerase sigma-70 factor (ECF subfamily)